MTRRAVLAVLLLLLAACAARAPTPEWEADAADALDAFQRHWLRGETDAGMRDYLRAEAAVSATGRPDRLARVRLARCGVQAAALEFATCADPVGVAGPGGAEEAAYGRFLAGRWQAADAAALPEAYRTLVRGGSDDARLEALRGIANPVSRLVAAGVMFRAGTLPPAGLDIAVDTASDAGLRRALLAWLAVQERRALEGGDAARAAGIRARIGIAGGR